MLVVDASVLANVLADDADDGRAARQAVRGAELGAPDLVDVETMSVLRKRWLAGDLTVRRFRAAVEDLSSIAIVRYPCLPLVHRAYELRGNVTPYDLMYLGLAEALDCPLVTSDARLAAAPGARCEVRLLVT